MSKNFRKTSFLMAALTVVVFTANFAFAQTAAPVAKKVPATQLSIIITRANDEIDKRVKDLNDLITRISDMKKITSNEQTNLNTAIQNEIAELTDLKTKINTETSVTVAKTDYQSITKSYRIYALILPRTRVIAASDRILSIIDSMSIVAGKIQTRISTLSGPEAATANQLLSDFNIKIGDASTQAQDATNAVLTLQSDAGDATKMATNTAALKDAKAKINTAKDDLAAAHKDLLTLAKNLKETKTTKP